MGLLRMNTEAATEPIRNNLVSIFQQLLRLQDTGWKPLPAALHMKGYAEFRAKPSYSEELFVGLRGPERPAILHYVSLTTDAGPAPQHVIIKQSGVGNRHTTIKHAQDTRDLLTNVISGCANHTVPNAGVSADNALDRAHAAAEPGPKVVDAFQDILRTGPHTWKSIGHGLEFEVFYQSGAPDSNLRHLSIRCVQDPMVQFSFFRSIGFGGLHIVSASLNIDHYIPEPDDVDARGLLQYIVKVCVQQLRKHGKQNLVQAAAEPHAAQPASVFLNKMAEHTIKRTITYHGVHFDIETQNIGYARLYVSEGAYGLAYVVVQDHNVSRDEYEHGSRVLIKDNTLNSINRSKTLHVIDTALNAEDLLRQVIEFAYKRRPGATAATEPPISNAAGYWLAQIVGRKLEREIRVGGRKGTIRCERRVGFLTVTMSGYGGVYNVVWQRTLEPQRAYDVAVVITDGDHASSSHGRILTVIEHASSVRDLLRQVLEFVAANERRRGNVEAAAEPAPESAIAQGYLRAFTSVLQHMLKSPKQVIDTEVQGTNGSRYKVTFRLTQQRFGNRDKDDISTNWQLSMTSTSFATSKQAYAGCVGTMYPARGPSPYFQVKGRQIDLEFADRKDLPSQPSQVFPFLAKVFLSKLVGAERIQAAAEPQAQERSGYIRVHLEQDQLQDFETRVKKIPGVIWKGILHENWAQIHTTWALLELVFDLDHTLPLVVELARTLEAKHLMVPGGVGKLFLPRYTPQLLQAVRNSHESLRANAASEPGSDLKQAFTEMVDHFEYGGSLGHLTEPGKNLIRHDGFDYMVWCHKNALRLWIRVYKTPVGSDNEAHRYPYVVDYDPDPQRVVVCRTPSMNGGSGIYRDVVLEITDSMTSKQLIRTVLAAVVSDTRKRAGKSAVAAAEPAPKPIRGRLTVSFGANRKNVLAFAAALKKQFPDVETSKEAKNIAGVQGKRAQYWYTVYPKLDPKLVQAILQLANTNGATEVFSASNSWTMSGLMNTPELASSLFRAMQGTIHEQWAQAASEPQETRNFTEELEKLALSYSNSRSGTWITPHFLCDGFARSFVMDGGHAQRKLQSYTIYVDFTATTEAKVDHPRTRYKFQVSLTYGRDERKPEPEMHLREVSVDTKHPVHREPRNVDVSELSPRDLLRRAVSDACLYVRENAKRLLEEIATEDPKFKNVSVTAAAEPEPQIKLEDIFNQLRDRTQVSRRDAQIDEYKSIAYDGVQVVLRNAHGADSNILFINSELPNQEWTSGTADFERGVVTLSFSNNVRAVRHLEIQEGDVHSSQELLRKIVAWYVGLHKKYVAQAGKKVQAAAEPAPKPSSNQSAFYDFADTLPDYRRGVPGKKIQTQGVTLDIVYDDMVSCVCVKVSRPEQEPRYVVAHFDHSLKKSQFMVLKDEHGVAIPNTAKNVDADSARVVLQKLVAYCLDNYPGVAEAAAEPTPHQDVVNLFRDIVVSIKPNTPPGVAIAGLRFWRSNGRIFMDTKGNGQYAASAGENYLPGKTNILCSFSYGGPRVKKYSTRIDSATSPKELLQQIITWYRASVKQRESDEFYATSAAEPELEPNENNDNVVLEMLHRQSRFRVRGVEIQVTPVPARTGTEWRLKVLNRPEHAGDEYLVSIGFDYGQGKALYELLRGANLTPYRTMLTVPLTAIPETKAGLQKLLHRVCDAIALRIGSTTTAATEPKLESTLEDVTQELTEKLRNRKIRVRSRGVEFDVSLWDDNISDPAIQVRPVHGGDSFYRAWCEIDSGAAPTFRIRRNLEFGTKDVAKTQHAATATQLLSWLLSSIANDTKHRAEASAEPESTQALEAATRALQKKLQGRKTRVRAQGVEFTVSLWNDDIEESAIVIRPVDGGRKIYRAWCDTGHETTFRVVRDWTNDYQLVDEVKHALTPGQLLTWIVKTVANDTKHRAEATTEPAMEPTDVEQHFRTLVRQLAADRSKRKYITLNGYNVEVRPTVGSASLIATAVPTGAGYRATRIFATLAWARSPDMHGTRIVDVERNGVIGSIEHASSSKDVLNQFMAYVAAELKKIPKHVEAASEPGNEAAVVAVFRGVTEALDKRISASGTSHYNVKTVDGGLRVTPLLTKDSVSFTWFRNPPVLMLQNYVTVIDGKIPDTPSYDRKINAVWCTRAYAGYSDQHRGIVIQYDRQKILVPESLNPQQLLKNIIATYRKQLQVHAHA